MDSATLDRYAKQAVALDPAGRVEFEDDRFNKPGVLCARGDQGAYDLDRSALPDNIRRNLERAGELAGPFEPRNSLQTWEETLYATQADGAGVSGSSAEALMVPIFTVPANYLYPGRLVRWTLFGRQSTVITTPGTITLRLSYSATGLGAVVVAASGAFAPDSTAAATTLTWMVEWWMICRSQGTTGTALGLGRVEWSDYDDASATALVANLAMRMAPVSAPATVTVDTTVARAISPTYQASVTTGSMICHLGILEALT